MDIFVDTSAFYSLADTRDLHHARARAVYEAHITRHRLYTSDLVVAETWSLVRGRLGRRAAMRWWAGMRTGIVTIAFVRLADLEAGWRIGQRYDHGALSLVDCVSFALMERLGIETAFAFDQRFSVYRFGVQSERAFRVLT
jgi:predicted nucleic acid-binding protein